MTDPVVAGDAQPLRCPWCSATITPGATSCPSCGAALQPPAEAEPTIPGVTSLDPLTAARRPLPKPNRIVSWLAGDLEPLPEPDPLAGIKAPPPAAAGLSSRTVEGATPDSYAPPSPEVRREMAKLELEAIRAELESRAPEASIEEAQPPSDEGAAGA